MVTKHKIQIDFYDDDFCLIAIHSSLEDHAIVYTLNRELHLRLARERKDLSLGDGIEFPAFGWEDELNDRYWLLLANSCQLEQKGIESELFFDEISVTRHYLIPERKEVDYFLKFESDETDLLQEVLSRLKRIPQIITSYALEPAELGSIENIMY